VNRYLKRQGSVLACESPAQLMQITSRYDARVFFIKSDGINVVELDPRRSIG
jgi:hypothetical protein